MLSYTSKLAILDGLGVGPQIERLGFEPGDVSSFLTQVKNFTLEAIKPEAPLTLADARETVLMIQDMRGEDMNSQADDLRMKLYLDIFDLILEGSDLCEEFAAIALEVK